MSANLVRALYNINAGNGVTSILYPVLAGADLEAAGTTVTAGGVARTYNPTVAAGFTSLIATATETADYLCGAAYFDTPSAVGTYFFRWGQGLATAEVVFERIKFSLIQVTAVGDYVVPALEFRTRRRVPAGTGINSRLSISCATIAGGNETILSHTAITRGC